MRSTKLPSWIESLVGLAPIPAPPDVFALTESEIRYGKLERTAEGLVLSEYRSAELPPECFLEGVLGGNLRDPQLFWQGLGEFVRSLPAPVKEASLVLPDAWLRLTFTELAVLPRKPEARDEVLRWKLKRLVPFRVEDLRLAAAEVTPFPNQEEPLRALLGFALESLTAQLEEAFQGVGIQLGQITNNSLALLAGLEHNVGSDDLGALVGVDESSYTLSFFLGGEPVVYRYKAFTDEMDEDVRARSVHRDLRLTASFVREHFPGSPLRRAFLAAPPELEGVWLRRLMDEIDTSPEPLDFAHFPLARTQVGPSWLEMGPLLGAACLEVG